MLGFAAGGDVVLTPRSRIAAAPLMKSSKTLRSGDAIMAQRPYPFPRNRHYDTTGANGDIPIVRQPGDIVPGRRGKSADKISIAKHNLARPSDRRFAARRFDRFVTGV